MGLFYALPLHPTPCHQKSPSRLSTSYLLTIYGQYQAASLLSRVGGGRWVGVVIIKLKANLSSTSHLTSQLELSLAIISRWKHRDYGWSLQRPSKSWVGLCTEWHTIVIAWVSEEYRGWRRASGILRVQRPKIPIIKITEVINYNMHATSHCHLPPIRRWEPIYICFCNLSMCWKVSTISNELCHVQG